MRGPAPRSVLRRYGQTRSAEAGPPVDAESARVADFALRLAEAMLANGAATADVESSVVAVCSAFGIAQTEIDVTFTALTVTLDRGDGSFPVTRVRVVRQRGGDFARLAMAHDLVLRITAGEIGRREALTPLAELEESGPPYPRWLVTLAWGTLAAAVTQVLGGGWMAGLFALVSTAAVDQIGRALRRRGWPDFFLNVVGGFVVTALAVLLTALEVPVRPSIIVAGGLVVLLSGVTFVATLQDAITGFMVTAAGRALEVVLLTGGIIAGVGIGLTLARQLDVTLAVLPPRASEIGEVPLRMAAAAVGTGAFALASHAPRRMLAPAAGLGVLAYVTYVLTTLWIGEAPAAAGVAAIAVGFAAHQLATRLRLPTLALVVPGTVMLLPGLTIVRGMLQINADDAGAGFLTLVTATTIALALAAGAITGEILSQPVDQELVRMERRLVRGGMVGVAAVRRVRRVGRRRPGQSTTAGATGEESAGADPDDAVG